VVVAAPVHGSLPRASTMTAQMNNGAGSGNAGTMILLGAAYPVFAHIAVISGRPELIAASIGLLAVLVLFPGLRRFRPAAWILLIAALIGLHQVAGSGHTLLLLFLPPILINGFMAWIFGNTLLHGRTPLIERAIILLHGTSEDITGEMAWYARRLTLAWTVLFVVLATINLCLAAIASPGGLLLSAGLRPRVTVPLDAWSLFANVLNYLIVAAMFAVEYQVRLRRFPQQSYGSFFNFIRRLAGVGALFRPTSANLAGGPGTGPREP
jgi:uncharacterized membrane protein